MPLTKRPAAAWILLRCTHGAMSGFTFPTSVWTGADSRIRVTKCWANAWRAGKGKKYPDVHVHRRIVCDRPARWPIDESQQAQLVVVGSPRPRRVHRQAGLGSGQRWPQAAKVPVIVVRSAVEVEMSDRTRPIVVGVDGSEAAMEAANMGRRGCRESLGHRWSWSMKCLAMGCPLTDAANAIRAAALSRAS